MKKPSEILKAALPIYSLNTHMYMCCLIEDAYRIDDIPFTFPVTLEEQRVVKNEILKRIAPYTTLMSYLEYTDDAYKRAYLKIDGCDDPMFGHHRTKLCHQLRIEWFEKLILELEKEDK